MPILHQRSIQSIPTNFSPLSRRFSNFTQTQMPISVFNRAGLLVLLSLMVILGVFLPWSEMLGSFFSSTRLALTKWRSYTLAQVASFVAKNGTLIVSAVSEPYLPFLNNWLISIARQKHHEKVLVIAEDNEKWPGHAVIIPPVVDTQTGHKFGSQGFFNFTSRRPRHLLNIVELGYNVLYNDVDMVWLADPFPYLEGSHDVYFTDEMAPVGSKLVLKTWIEELEAQPWSRAKKANDQPAFNWDLMKTAQQGDLYLLPQVAFPTGGLYFKNKTWVKETKGLHVIIHNNYILGFEKKIKWFREYGFWLVDDYYCESPLGRL